MGNKIDSFVLGSDYEPYIIAEIGVNHEGSLEKAKLMIDQVAKAGGHAAKFQTYKADTLASKQSPAYWDLAKESTKSQHALFKKYDSFEKSDYIELHEYCEKKGIHFLSTPFDLESANYLCDLMPVIKIASADITNRPLIELCASKRKPLIMSTGASSYDEISNSVEIATNSGAEYIVLLHCVLNYPTPENKANMLRIRDLQKNFPNVLVGYSDHVPPQDESMPSLEMATQLGSVILEKHFTFDKKLSGNDHYHSMDFDDLHKFVSKIKTYKALSTYYSDEEAIKLQESARQHARRSLFYKKDLPKGKVLEPNDIIAKRPAHGISPIRINEIIGKKLKCDVSDDQYVSWTDLL